MLSSQLSPFAWLIGHSSSEVQDILLYRGYRADLRCGHRFRKWCLIGDFGIAGRFLPILEALVFPNRKLPNSTAILGLLSSNWRFLAPGL